MPQDIARDQPRQRSEKVGKADAGLLAEDSSVEVADVGVMRSEAHEFDEVDAPQVSDALRVVRQFQVIVEHDFPAPDHRA